MPATVLTDEQKMAIYEILDVPQATSYQTVTGLGFLTAETTVTAAALSAAYTALTAAIAALVDPQAARVAVICDAWNDRARLKLARLTDGQVGNLTNMSLDYDGFKAECRALMQNYLPYYKRAEVIQKEMSAASGFSIGIGR